jgi:hypothetical protein
MLAQSTAGVGATAEQICVNRCWRAEPLRVRSRMTSDDHPSRSEHYRDVADSLRRLARQTRFPEVRQELFDLAEGFDRMAEFPEKWHTADREP